MSGPQDEPTPDRVQTPTVSTAPTSGETPPGPRWWHWGALPDHLGRARTSTVVLSVLFVAVFALYLNVRPDVATTGTSPAGGSSDVEAPANPVVPSEPTTQEPTEEPAPTTDPDGTEPSEETETPTTSGTPSSSTTRPTTPATEPSDAPATTAPTPTTGGTTAPSTSAPSPTTGP